MVGEAQQPTHAELLREREMAKVLDPEQEVDSIAIQNIGNTLLGCCPEEVADFDQSLADQDVEGDIPQRNLRKLRFFVRTQLLGESVRAVKEKLDPTSAVPAH